MTEIKFDKELAARAYDLIAEKYATEGGKKFIFHLISSFVVPSNYKVRQMTLEDSKNYRSTECCITKVKIAPIDVMIPQDEGLHYYGWITDGSNKIVSVEGLLALQEFIKKRLEIGDDAIAKIQKYVDRLKNKDSQSNRYQPHPDRKAYMKNKDKSQKSPKYIKTNETPRYYPRATMGDVMTEEVTQKLTQSIKKDKVVKESKAKYEDKNAFPDRKH